MTFAKTFTVYKSDDEYHLASVTIGDKVIPPVVTIMPSSELSLIQFPMDSNTLIMVMFNPKTGKVSRICLEIKHHKRMTLPSGDIITTWETPMGFVHIGHNSKGEFIKSIHKYTSDDGEVKTIEINGKEYLEGLKEINKLIIA